MKRFLSFVKKTFLVIWTLFFITGIISQMSNYVIWDFIEIFSIMSIPYIIFYLLSRKKKKNNTHVSTENNDTYDLTPSAEVKAPSTDIDTSSNTAIPTYLETDNMIYRVDDQPISEEEIPYLIEITKQQALEQYEQAESPKVHRSEREENLSVQFMMNHSNEIQKHTDSFEECNRLAYAEKDLNKKIQLLQETINLYEKEKKWFYRTKGGMIYFQDFYEHMHNSRNNDFSYIDSVKNYLEECIKKRDYIIPEILNLITSSNGILQKDIYKHLPDMSKSEIQQTIRELETENLITRTKKSNSYFLTMK